DDEESHLSRVVAELIDDLSTQPLERLGVVQHRANDPDHAPGTASAGISNTAQAEVPPGHQRRNAAVPREHHSAVTSTTRGSTGKSACERCDRRTLRTAMSGSSSGNR